MTTRTIELIERERENETKDNHEQKRNNDGWCVFIWLLKQHSFFLVSLTDRKPSVHGYLR